MEKTVLVVDDIAANRNLLGETLEPKGYEVLLASNGAMALKVAAKAKPRVILMDVNMPDMDGYEACRQLKADSTLAEIPVIFITANDDQESLIKGFQVGGVDYIAKPFKEQEVIMRVETHLKIHTLTKALQSEVELRREAEEKANDANEAKSKFLSFISHEMRSPLNAMIGFGEELVDSLDGEGQADHREDARSILRSGKHLLGLINNLLDLSKIEAGKMPLVLEDFSPTRLVDELARDIEPLINKRNNKLSVEANAVADSMHADPTKMKQVLMNLLSNASKFTDAGEIVVSLGASGDDAIQITVKDSGIGMSEEEMGRLFQAYNQANDSTSKNFGGTGLGLVISRQYCQLMGGDLTVESEPGKGSTFTMRIPVKVKVKASGE
jgi:signal transduction histidine kinase